jgi:hypothetical protein
MVTLTLTREKRRAGVPTAPPGGGGARKAGTRAKGSSVRSSQLTSVSPFSFVRLAGRPEAMASSSTSLFPSRAALYICAARRMASSDGEKAVADVSSWLIFVLCLLAGSLIGRLD